MLLALVTLGIFLVHRWVWRFWSYEHIYHVRILNLLSTRLSLRSHSRIRSLLLKKHSPARPQQPSKSILTSNDVEQRRCSQSTPKKRLARVENTTPDHVVQHKKDGHDPAVVRASSAFAKYPGVVVIAAPVIVPFLSRFDMVGASGQKAPTLAEMLHAYTRGPWCNLRDGGCWGRGNSTRALLRSAWNCAVHGLLWTLPFYDS